MTGALLLLLLGWAALSYYFGFVHRDRLLAWRSQAAFVVAVALLIPVTVWALWGERQAVRELRRYLRPYPAVTDVIDIPGGAPGETAGILVMLETRDGIDDVLAFYREPRHRPDWDMAAQGAQTLTLKRDDLTLTVMVTENFGATRRTISYRLVGHTPP